MAFKSFDDIRKVVLKRSESFGFGSGYDGPEDIKSSNPEYIKKQREKQGYVNFNENKTITQTSSEPKIRRKAFDSSSGYKYNNIFDIYKGLKNANKSSSKREPFKPVNNEYKYNSVIDLLKQPAIYDMPKSKIEDIYLKTYFANSFDDYEPSKNSFKELTKGYVPKTSEQKRNYEKALLEDRANRKLGEDNKLLGILGYLGASFNSGVAYGDTVGNALFNREADPYSEVYQAARAASSIKEGLLSDIESKPGRFLAETGLSMLENASRFALKPTGAAISLGLTTGGQKATSELLKGVDTSSAAKSATVSAAIETVTEKIPLDNLYKVYKTAGKVGVRNAVKTVLKQAGIEATEESISNITNVLSDKLILKDKSDYEIYKNELIKSGMNEKEAEREATKKFLLIDTLFSAAGGALSGGVFGSVGVAGAKIRTNSELKKRDAKLKEGILPKNSVSSEVSDNSNDLQLVRGNDGVLYLTSDPLSVNNLTKKSDGIYYENTETLKNNADLGIDYNNKKLSDYVKENNNIYNQIYTPTIKELYNKQPSKVTKITSDINSKLSNEEFTNLYKKTLSEVKQKEWFNKEIINNDLDFRKKYGELKGVIKLSTLKKGRSHRTKYGVEQILIMPHLKEIFENATVINVKYDEKNKENIDRIYTLLSPVVFNDNRVGVVKLNVKEIISPNKENRLHENKILDIQDIEISENKKSGVSTSTQSPSYKNEVNNVRATPDTLSIEEMLKFVKGEDNKYLPNDYKNSIKTDQELADVIGAKEANKILNLIQNRPDLELFSDLVDSGIYPTVKKGTAAYDYIEQIIKKRLNESIYDFRVKTENFAKDRDFVLNETLNSEINDILNEFGVLTDDNYYKFTDNLKNLSEIMTPEEIHDYVPVLNYEIDGSYEVAKNVMKYISEPLNRRQNAKNLIEAVKKFKDDGKNFDIKQSILTGAEVDLFQPFKSNSRYLSDLNTVLNDKLKQYPYYLKKIVKDKFMSEFRMEELKAEAFENYKKATTEKEKNDILNLLKFHLNEANDFSKYSFIKESIFDIGHTPVDFIEIENKLNYLKNKLNNNPDYINFSNELNKPENIKAKRRFKDFLNDEIDFKELVPNKYSFLNKAPANFFEISKEIHDLKSIKSAYRREVLNNYREEAEFNIENSDNWYDLSNLSYKTDTGIRNSFKIMPTTKEAEAFNEYYFKQVQKNEADSIRFKKQLIDEIKSLNLSDKKKYDISIKFKGDSLPTDLKVSESGLVQLLGEKRITLDDIKRVGADSDKILNSVNTIRDIYNRIYVLLNDTLIRNGLDPVPFRKDYFPHFNENDDLLNVIASNFGLEILNIDLPTNIAGLTHMFSPNRQFSGHLTERKGDYTDFDVLKGIDRYLPAVSNIIFHTDDIQRFKALERAIRDKYSSINLNEEMKKIFADEYLSPEEKLSKLDELRNRKLTHLNNFVKEINRYITVLTGKKSLVDRALEDAFSRKAYSVFGRLSNYVGSGMVGFNVSSAFTNFIPITQALSDVSGVNMLKGIKDTLTGRSLEDGLSERSDFLVRRKGHDLLSPNNFRKITDKGFLLMTALDNFASESIVRAKLYDNFKKGMDYESALKDADAFASEVMADRSFGSLPTIYSEKNPLTKAFTMFQLEVKNQYGYMFHDLPRRKQEEGLAVLAYSLLKMFLGAYLFNDIYEKISGRRAAFDPLSTLNGLVGDLAGVQVKNSVDIFNDYLNNSSDSLFLKPVSKKRGIEAAYDLRKEVISEIPFVGTIFGGGRIPTLAFFPDSAENLIKYSDPEISAKKRKEALTEEALNLLYLVPGGGQVKKSIQGYNVLKNGGLYTYDSDGNKKLKFPVEKITPFKTVQGLTFGRWSFPEAVKYINGEIKSLSVSKTDYWEEAKKNGINYFDFYKAIEITKDVLADKDSKGNSVPNSSSIKKKYLIDSNFKNLDSKQKEILYKAVGVSDTVINGKKGAK